MPAKTRLQAIIFNAYHSADGAKDLEERLALMDKAILEDYPTDAPIIKERYPKDVMISLIETKRIESFYKDYQHFYS